MKRRQHQKPDKLPVAVDILKLPCAACGGKSTRQLFIGIYPAPFCDTHEPPKEPTRKQIHTAMVLDCNRAAGSLLEAMSLACKLREALGG